MSAELHSSAAAALQQGVERLKREIGKVIVGQSELVSETIVALLCGGHVLIEGSPGLGKTSLVRALSQGLELSFSRVQFTPDLMPADITGANVLQTDDHHERIQGVHFQRGPIFAHLVLADEINRATPKTQSALLEAMQERSVTVSGHSYELESPFFVIATQNPIEMEGTYPLPEAQVDRFFFKLQANPPTKSELRSIVERTTGERPLDVTPVLSRGELLELQKIVRETPIASHVLDYAVQIVHATRPESPDACPEVRRYVRYGASPRGAQSLVLAAKAKALLEGRFNVAREDIRAFVLPALRHRVLLDFQAISDGVDSDDVLKAVIESVGPGEIPR